MGIETALIAGAVGSLGAAAMDNRSQRKAMSKMEQQRAQSKEFVEKSVKNARSDIFKLFPAAQQSRQQGLDAGLSLYQQAYPQMMNAFQGGNVAAQNAVIQGLGQSNNALLGNAVNTSFLQPQALPMPQGLQLPNAQLQPINQLGLENG